MFRHTLTKIILTHAESILIIVLSAVATFSALTSQPGANAANMPNRSIIIGTSEASAVTSHRFGFDIVSSAAVGSIQFEYCTNSPLVGAPCTVPPGLDVSGAVLASQTGVTGFSIHASSGGNRLVLTRTPSAVTPQPATYGFTGVVNHSDPQSSVFVRISTHASDDATGTWIDEGTVLYSTARNLIVGGYVPPYLTFCVGVTVATNCSATQGDSIDLGELSRNQTSAATSEFAAATNDVTGYNVGVYGNTMTSGNNIIPALAANDTSSVGTSQYGLNLRDNSAPNVGQNPAGIGTAGPTAPYAVPNSFRFANGDAVARSPIPSDFNRFTVSYLVNVAGGQQPGVYATTMTFIATASF